MATLLALAFIIITPLIAINAYLLGKYHERRQWNRLIKDGHLPRPNNPSLDHSQYWANQ